MHCTHGLFPGLGLDGGFAQYFITNERALIKLNPNITPLEVAPMADAGITAYRAAKKAAKLLRPGAYCVLLGIGGLGHIALQCLHAMSGCRTIAIDRVPAARQLAKELGADFVLDGGPNVVDEVRELTGGGAQVVIDFVGELGVENLCWKMVRKGGQMYVVGYGGKVEVPTVHFVIEEINVGGSLVGNYTELVELMELNADGKVEDALQPVQAGRHQHRARRFQEPALRRPRRDRATMKALVYLGPGRRRSRSGHVPKSCSPRPTRWSRSPRPRSAAPTCTSSRATCRPASLGRVLGHEGVGVVEEVGAGGHRFKPGDRVLISCISSCGKCEFCRRSMYSHCTTGGWILGHLIDGTQAEYVRIPHADTSLYPIPDGADEEALVMLSDILPTGFECGVLNGKVQPGGTVAIVGAGPVGLGCAADGAVLFAGPADRRRPGQQPARGRPAIRCDGRRRQLGAVTRPLP